MLLLCGVTVARAVAQSGPDAFFESRIRPVLVTTCVGCHGPSKASQGLRLDTRAGLLDGGDSGAAIRPGAPESSLLIQALRRTRDDLQMPPDKPLPATVIADFVQWVQDGAVWPDLDRQLADQPHWSFQPVLRHELPPADAGDDHPIDRFVAASRAERNLHPVAPAAPRALVRRLYFDLIGLPPPPEEVERLERELLVDRDAAISRLVDQLLDSPHYGERWGRHWMDVVRYADTAGDNADYPVPEAHLYRNYIIDAFNADKPYDQFVREQLAGDLLASESAGKNTREDASRANPDSRRRYAEQIAATGFLALSRRYGTAPYELWHLTLEDTIDTVGRTFLGLTLKCARCHDHKFDPLTTRDYYALYGIFNSTQFPWAGGEEFRSKKLPREHFVPLIPDDEFIPRRDKLEQQLDAMAAEIAALENELQSVVGERKTELSTRLAALGTERLALQRSSLPPDVAGAYAVREGKPADAVVQAAGDPQTPGPAVPRGVPAFLAPVPIEIPSGQSGRLQLAEWLTRPDHPLTARVMVNRVWQHHFGRGLVLTPSNLGTSGAAPTHPELLDDLAAKFVDSGWSVKALHRWILTSKTWQLSSEHDDHDAALDPGNEYYWRHDRRRLEAEAIRDAILSVAGELRLDRPPPHPFPPIASWNWTQHSQFKDRYESSHRSVYLMTQRLQRHPFLALFDGPDTNTSTERRTTATVTPQALYLLNSPEMTRLSAALARRLIEKATDVDQRIDWAHRWCFGRPATERERERGREYIAACLAALRDAPTADSRVSATAAGPSTAFAASSSPEHEAWTGLSRALLSSNEFCYLD